MAHLFLAHLLCSARRDGAVHGIPAARAVPAQVSTTQHAQEANRHLFARLAARSSSAVRRSAKPALHLSLRLEDQNQGAVARLSGFFSGLCRPDLGTACRLRTKGSTSPGCALWLAVTHWSVHKYTSKPVQLTQ